MAGRDERQSPDSQAVPVPQLIEEYRVRRDAWMAQADELTRLREEVKSSAEREALEIVTAARRDIRQIVMEARRELLVLSAQVQAALGEASGPPLVDAAQISAPQEATTADDLSELVEEEWGFAPRASVKRVLEEARADMAHLAEDARELTALKAAKAAEPQSPEPAVTQQTAATAVSYVPASPSKGVLSSYQTLGAGFLTHADTADLRPGRSVKTFVAFLAVIGVTAVSLTIWFLRGPAAPASAAASRPAAATPAAVPAPPTPAANPPAVAERPAAGVRIAIQTLRPARIRAIVDDRPSAGRTLEAGRVYEFNGSRTIALRVGDAGAVSLSVNGGESRILGRDGQVVNRLFAIETPGPSAPAETDQVTRSALEPETPSPAAPVASVAVPHVPDVGAAVTVPPPRTTPAPLGTDRVPVSAPDPVSESMLTAAAQQWLDAYHRQDRATLAALSAANLVVNDERPTNERMPVTGASIARTLDRVSVQSAADTAVLTAVMTERVVGGGLQRSSPVSLVWVQSDGTWRLSQVRLVSESRLSQIFR